MTAVVGAWPEPYLQPDGSRDCTFYATAYAARCLGFSDVTAQDVMSWRERENKVEQVYIQQALGRPASTYRWSDDEAERRRYWMGPDARPWVERWLTDHIGVANVHRIPTMGHAVVVLEAHEDGVLLMDPLSGFVIESWSWFLGIGPGTHGCHRIDGWYCRKGIA